MDKAVISCASGLGEARGSDLHLKVVELICNLFPSFPNKQLLRLQNWSINLLKSKDSAHCCHMIKQPVPLTHLIRMKVSGACTPLLTGHTALFKL